MLLSLKNLFVGFDSKVVVKANTSFDVGFNLIMAESGTGKSTLLKTIALIKKPLSGHIEYNGKSVKVRDMSWAKVCKLLKQGEFYFEETVKKSIEMVFDLKGNKDVKLDVEQLYYFLEIFRFSRDILKEQPQKISGGQRQRIALIRAMLLNPEVFLVDEPTTGMDEELVNITFNLLKNFCKARICLIVSHETSAQDLADRALSIKNGKLVG